MAKAKESKTKVTTQEVLAVDIAASLNKDFSKTLGKIAYIGGGESPSDIIDWVSTGNDILDLAISNRPNGGLPVGRIVEITGLEASGKSLLAAHVLAETQRKGGLAVYFDTESAMSTEFFDAIGIDTPKMLNIQMNTLEDIFASIEKIISKVRESENKRLVTIIVDSVMGATTKVEEASDYDKDGWATSKAIILSKAMRKITGLIAREKILLVFTNQLRVRLGVTFGDKWTTSGGKAIPFHSSVRLRMQSMAKIKTKLTGPDSIIGIKTSIKVIKNRLGPPHRTMSTDIYFDSGIDRFGSWLTQMKELNIVTIAGAWYTYEYKGTPIKFQSKDFKNKLDTITGLRDHIYKHICDEYIMVYKPNVNFGIDDIELEDVTAITTPTS